MTAQKSYRSHIETEHPLLTEVFGNFPEGAPAQASVEGLRHALRALELRFFYTPVRGRTGFDQLLEKLRAADAGDRAADADDRVAINCYDLSCLLASHCRAAGWSSEEAFVVFCDRRLSPEHARVDFHACNLLRIAGEAYWVEPERLRLKRWAGEDILREYKIRVAFNDKHIYFTEDEKNDLILGTTRSAGQQIYLYGQGQEVIEAVHGRPSFQTAVRRYFADGGLDFGDDTPTAEQAVDCGLVVARGDRLEPGPRLVLVPRSAELELRAELGSLLDIYLGIVAGTIPRLRRAFDDTATARRFEWEEVAHVIVAGLLMDLAAGANLELADDVNDRCGAAVIWAFENVSAVNGFGVQWHPGDHPGQGISQLWHRRVERQPMRLAPAMTQQLVQHALGQTEITSSPEWLYLKFQKVVREGRIVPPVFGPDDTSRLLEPLLSAGEELATESIRPAFSLAAEHPWWGRIDDDPSYRHSVVRLMLEYAIDRVVATGLLPPFPDGTPPVAWGRWVWIEPSNSPGRLMPAFSVLEEMPL